MSSYIQMLLDHRDPECLLYASRDVTFPVFDAFYHSVLASDVVLFSSYSRNVCFEFMDSVRCVYSPLCTPQIHHIKRGTPLYVRSQSEPSKFATLYTEDRSRVLSSVRPLLCSPLSTELNFTWTFIFKTYTYTLLKRVRGATKHAAVTQDVTYTLQLSTAIADTNVIEFQRMVGDLFGQRMVRLDWDLIMDEDGVLHPK